MEYQRERAASDSTGEPDDALWGIMFRRGIGRASKFEHIPESSPSGKDLADYVLNKTKGREHSVLVFGTCFGPCFIVSSDTIVAPKYTIPERVWKSWDPSTKTGPADDPSAKTGPPADDEDDEYEDVEVIDGACALLVRSQS